MVKSPYNFVPAPAEAEVFTPEWANQVSHDIPFEDGESGEIEVKITAQTPIFIRNGHSKGDGEIFDKWKKGELPNPSQDEQAALDRYLNFSNNNGEYFIPATSIKGMLRNVLEIMSFSRMKQMNDDRHSVRQIMRVKNVVMNEGYDLTNEKEQILCGYLIKRDNKYWIHSCGSPYKIRYTDLDEIFDNKFSLYFQASVSNNFDERTGVFKYENIIGRKDLEYKFEDHPRDDEAGKQKSWVSKFQPLNYVRKETIPSTNSFWGRIVCVGQASEYNVSTSRKGEYVFKGIKEEILNKNNLKVEVPSDKMDTFLFLNRDGKKESEELKDWSYWKNKITDGIPVFFRKNKDNQLIDFGLTFMYKQPVQFSTKELLPYKPGADLAECIFGTTQTRYESKGRILVSNFKVTGKIDQSKLQIQDNILSSPKSSFTPFYIEQTGNNGKTIEYNTYQQGNPTIRGYKRYPVQQTAKKQVVDITKPKLISKSIPLPQNTVFEGKIRYHNLKKIELGALFSAITIHNSNEVFFNLGGIKSFGYGRIKIEILNKPNNFNNLIKEFEIRMKAHNHSKWNERLLELISMSKLSRDESKLEHMELANFQKVKENGYYLQKYSTITGFNDLPKSLATIEEVNIAKKEIQNEKDRLENKKTEILNNAKNALENDKFDESIELYEKYSKQVYDFDIKTTIEEVEKLRLLYLKFGKLKEENDLNKIEVSLSSFFNTKWYSPLVSQKEGILRSRKLENMNKIANDEFEVDNTSFLTIKSSINKVYDKIKTIGFSEEKKMQYQEILKENFLKEIENKKSEWKKYDMKFGKYPWTDIVKWLGETQAKALHETLTKNI